MWPQPAPFWHLRNAWDRIPRRKVNSVNLFPLSFTEFLGATGNGRYAELIEKGDLAMMNTFSDKLKELLRTYYIVGGMPEAVNAYIDTADVRDAREVQDQILVDYMSDFAKHVPANLLARTMLAWTPSPSTFQRRTRSSYSATFAKALEQRISRRACDGLSKPASSSKCRA